MPKHILMIVYTDYPFDARVRREAETLASLGEFSVSVLALKQQKKPRKYSIRDVRVYELNAKKYDGKNKIKYLYSYFKFLILSFWICSIRFLQGKVDIVHIHNMPDFLVLAGILPRCFKKTLILDIHDSMPETYSDKFARRQGVIFRMLCLEEFLSAALANRIICVNHVQRQILVERGIPRSKILVSLNVPDPKIFKLNGRTPGQTAEKLRFKMIYHGTIANRLGVDLAVEAMAIIGDRIPELEFHIWGKSGDELETIDRLSHRLNVADRVHIIKGGVALEKLPEKLAAMDIGIIGNRRGQATELMLPVKMLEYIALGIPVIAPKLKAIEHYFSDEMVCFYEPENIQSMAGGILKLYQDKELRKTQALNAKAFLDKYGWDKHKFDLINLYRNS